MAQLIQIFLWIPFFGMMISAFLPRKKESIISLVSISTIGLHLCAVIVFIAYWLLQSSPVLDIKHIVLFKAGNIEIFIDFYFDKTTAVFAILGSLLSFLVSVFSRYYLHRDEGYKRFFNTILLFFLGYNFIIFAGNFETLFIGWEILGICSFLLIAFYRNRYLPVKNALKVVSVYRLGDICLILAMWMSHHLWHQNITFNTLNDSEIVAEHLNEHNWYGIFIALMIVIAAAAKSAQFPFSSWLPRAMEGPTSSSAIFYGSLSVHLGVFLLLRTYPYWESLVVVKAVIIVCGIVTSLIASGIARVQSSVKTQVAYATITQIGLIFIEVALGFHILALIHLSGNALLRTYQLLVSPSVLSYLTHDMFFNFKAKKHSFDSSFFTKIKNTLYILSIKEWNLDTFMFRYLWSPFKWIGTQLHFLRSWPAVVLLIILFEAGIYINYLDEVFSSPLFELFPYIFSIIGLMLVLKAFADRGNATRAWLFIVAGQLFITLSITLLHEDFGSNYIILYLGGSIVSALVGFICLKKIKNIDNDIELNKYHGYVYEQPRLAFIFLLSCLGLIGLPFTPTFIGIDILFSHIHKHEEIMIISTALSFIFIELSVLRIYSRIFMGLHKKQTHAMTFRSS